MAKSQQIHELRGSTNDYLERRLEEIIKEAFDALEGKVSLSRQEASDLRAEREAILAEQKRREDESTRARGTWQPEEVA